MNAIETDLFRVFPPLETKEKEEGGDEEKKKEKEKQKEEEKGKTRDEIIKLRLERYKDNENLSKDLNIAIIQVLYPENFVITLKNHLALRGVKNTTFMTTPEELEKLLQASSGSGSDSDDGKDKKKKKKDPHAHANSLSAPMNRDNDIVLGADDEDDEYDDLEEDSFYSTIDIDECLNSTEDINSFLGKTETASLSTIKDEDGNCKLNLATFTDTKILEIKHKHVVEVLRLYEDTINDLIVSTEDLNDLLDEYKGLVHQLSTEVQRLNNDLESLEEDYNEYKEEMNIELSILKEKNNRFKEQIIYLASLHGINIDDQYWEL